MTTVNEVRRWFKDAKSCLEGAKDSLLSGKARFAIHNAQLCIEQSTKAVIACFSEPMWEHDPKDQLEELLEEYEDEIVEMVGEEFLGKVKDLGKDSAEVAEWHGLSTYGKRIDEETWLAAVDVCTPEVAEEMVEKAERNFETASKFLRAWFGERW